MSANLSPIVRFAPSPTGRLHIGNLRTALLNWLFARKHGGLTVLRFDDTDRERSKPEFEQGIREDLAWLGLSWDREEKQSLRLARYTEAAEGLKARGLLYPCFETEDELDRQRKLQRARGLPPVFDRARALDPETREKHERDGRHPHWRFKLPVETGAHDRAAWDDLIRGHQEIDLGSLSDPVLVRVGGTYLYTFTSVVDDIDFAVTHIIRGDDHVTNTGVQSAIFTALGATPPRFAHHSLLVGSEGEALSKRLGSLSLQSLRLAGLEPMAVLSHAALIGTSHPIQPHRSLDSLASLFDFAKVSRSPARFDVEELKGLNAKLLHEAPYETERERLAALGVGGGDAFWQAVRGNLTVLAEARDWWQVATGEVAPVVENADLCAKAAGLMPPEPWTTETWKTWTDAIKAATGAKGRDLFHPLRSALTGREAGPEMKFLLPFIGRDRAAMRLNGRTG